MLGFIIIICLWENRPSLRITFQTTFYSGFSTKTVVAFHLPWKLPRNFGPGRYVMPDLTTFHFYMLEDASRKTGIVLALLEY